MFSFSSPSHSESSPFVYFAPHLHIRRPARGPSFLMESLYGEIQSRFIPKVRLPHPPATELDV